MNGRRPSKLALRGAALCAALLALFWAGVQPSVRGRPAVAADLGAAESPSAPREHEAPRDPGGAPDNTRLLARALDRFWRAIPAEDDQGAVAAPPAQAHDEAAAAPPAGPLVPTVDALRQEVAANPHGAPPSLIDFALGAHAQLQQALASESEAMRLIEQIEALVAAPEALSEVVHAVFHEQAQELAGRYPGLEVQCARLWREAPERVLRLVP